MKTKEEILGSFGITDKTVHHVYSYLWKSVLEAMQLYSDQQNKELKEKVEAMTMMLVSSKRAMGNDIDEIQRLTKEVEELKRINEALRDNFPKVAYTTDANDKLSQELTRLRELLEKTKPYLSAHREYQYASQERKVLIDHLLNQIDNALNHKPHG